MKVFFFYIFCTQLSAFCLLDNVVYGRIAWDNWIITTASNRHFVAHDVALNPCITAGACDCSMLARWVGAVDRRPYNFILPISGIVQT